MLLKLDIYNFVKEYNIQKYKSYLEIPFNIVNKYSITVNEYEGKTAFLKGAPERILRMCTHYFINNQVVPLPANFQSVFDSHYARMASQGQRVLGLAMRKTDASTEETIPTSEYCLIGLMDPPKPKVKAAIASCQTAGIRVFMVTGDHPLTAEAIARQVGLLIGETKEQAATRLNRPLESISEDEYDAVVIHGENLSKLSNLEWNKILNKTQVVFARTSPKQKLEIVARCQAKGHVVAVTGDGVNDAPALKKSDLGISMNISGSDVSKEAAKMILLDDDFSSIVEAIAQGRLVFANLKKAVLFTMSHIMAEAWAFIAYIVFPLPALSSALLIIMIDLFIDSVAAVLFVNEEEESNLMAQAPRRQVTPTTLVVNEEDAMQLQRIESFKMEMVSENGPSTWYGKLIKSVWTKKKDKEDALIDTNLLIQAYVQVASIQMIGGTFAFFLSFYLGTQIGDTLHYLAPSELWGTTSFPRSDGVELPRGFNADAWAILYPQACASYWLMIVVPQMFDLFIVKSSSKTVFHGYIFKNKAHLLVLFWMTAMACLLIYTPGLQTVMGAYGPSGWVWLVGVVTGCCIIAFDCLKKFLFKMGYFGGLRARPADKIDGISRVLTR